MARDVTGTIRKVGLDGVNFRCAGDANLSQIFTEFENSLIPTSGQPMRKMVKRTQAVEGLPLILNTDEREQVKAFAEQLGNIKLSYTNAAGDQFKAEGTIEVENMDTEEGRATVQLLPVGGWTPFVA
jgi:hypothetical protein